MCMNRRRSNHAPSPERNKVVELWCLLASCLATNQRCFIWSLIPERKKWRLVSSSSLFRTRGTF